MSMFHAQKDLTAVPKTAGLPVRRPLKKEALSPATRSPYQRTGMYVNSSNSDWRSRSAMLTEMSQLKGQLGNE